MTEENPLPQTENDKTASRRSRKDQEGRDYVCGCGKKYLSYPALYTHIKTKHEGKQPQGTQKTGTNFAIKRIRPKLQQQTLRQIHSYFQIQDLNILKQFEASCEGSVPLHSRIKKQTSCKQIYECFSNLMKTQSVKISKESSLDLILTVYLLNVGEYVCDKLFDYYVVFAQLLRNCYHDHGEQVYRSCFQKETSGSFSKQRCEYLPIICDFLMRYYIPTEKSQVNLTLIELLLYDFCLWMRKYNLTSVRVILKKDYHLQGKPIQHMKLKEIVHEVQKLPSEEVLHSQNQPQNHKQPQKYQQTSKNQQLPSHQIPQNKKQSQNSQQNSSHQIVKD